MKTTLGIMAIVVGLSGHAMAQDYSTDPRQNHNQWDYSISSGSTPPMSYENYPPPPTQVIISPGMGGGYGYGGGAYPGQGGSPGMTGGSWGGGRPPAGSYGRPGWQGGQQGQSYAAPPASGYSSGPGAVPPATIRPPGHWQ